VREGHREAGRHGSFRSRRQRDIVPRDAPHVDAALHNSLLPIVTTIVCERAHSIVPVFGTAAVHAACAVRFGIRFRSHEAARFADVRAATRRRKKNAAGRPREYSQTPSDEGNKQLWTEV
jgi:hypothetical protein